MSSSGIRVSGGTRVHFVSQWEHFNSWSYSLLSAFGIKSIQSGKRTMANPVIILATAAIVCTVLAPANSELCINTPKCHDVITHKDMCDSTAQLSFVQEHCAKFCGLCNYSRLDGGETNKLPVSPTSICDDTAEVVFVLDGSSSVGKANFEKVRKFTQDVTREMKLEYQKLNVTVITFSNEAQVTLQLNESVDISAMVAQEANITYTHGGTETHKALNLMYQSYHHNVNSSKIAIVITDGASFEPALTRQAAENAKKNGVTIFVIAVGDDVNPHETQGISSDPDERYLKFLRRFSDLQQIVGFFHTRNCTTTTTTTITTTTTPTTTTTTTETITTKQKTTTTTVPQTEATSKPTTVTSATVTNRPSLITGQSPSAKPVSVIGLSPSAKPPFIAQSTESGNIKTPGFVSGRSPSAAPYTNTGVPPSLVPPIGSTAKTQKPIVQTGETVGIQTKPSTKPTTTTTMETPAPTTPTTTTQPTTKSTTTTTEATPAPTTPTTTTTQPTTKSTTTLATTKPTTKSTTTTTEATPAPTTPTTTTTQPTTKSTTTMATTKPTTKSTTTTTEATPAPTTPTTTTTQPTIKSTTTLATTKPTTKLTTTTTEATPAPTTPTTTTTQPTTKSTTTVATTKPTTKSTTTTNEATPGPTTPTTTTTQPTPKSTTLMATTKPTSKSATTTTEATPAPTKPTTTTTQPTTKSTTPVVTSKPTTKASSPTTTTTVLTTQPTPIPTTTTQPTVKSTTSTTQSTKASTKATSPVQLAHSSPTTTTQQPSTTTTEPPVTTSTVPPTTTTASCIAKIADVVFVVDTSGSIGLANFEKVKRFIKEVVMTFDIDSRYTRVALIEYSSDARIEFKLNEKTNLTDLLDAIDNVTYSGGGTSTSDALQLMRQEGFERERPAAPDIAVIITDGLSKFPSLTRAQANLAKKDGITMFSIGIGNLTASSELFAMATNRHYVFEVGDYETLLLLDNVVAHRACGIVLPEEYHSRSTTPLTTTQKGCRDLDANCVNYPRDSCTDYAPYARKNCARKCGYCPEYPLVEPLCEDKEPNCASYGTQICFSSSQYDWVDEHCRKFCSFCGNKTEIEETTTTTPTTPVVSTAPSCVDVDTRCDKYGGPSMCTQPSYETWAKYNCKKYCGYCYSYHTVTSATVHRVRCPAWTLPEQCVLEYSGGQCCPYPKCPDGFKLTIKRKLK